MDVGCHVEAFYRFALNDHIDILPGVVWMTAPNHNADNDDEIFAPLEPPVGSRKDASLVDLIETGLQSELKSNQIQVSTLSHPRFPKATDP